MRVGEQSDRTAEMFDSLSVVCDPGFFRGDVSIGANNEVAGENLWGLHCPEIFPGHGAKRDGREFFLDGVRDPMGEDRGVGATGEFEERAKLRGADERTGAVVDEDVGDVRRERGQGGYDGILAFAPAPDEERGRGRVGTECEHLAAVSVHNDVEVGDTAGGKRSGGIREDRAAGERREDFVGDGAGHACAASGGE